MSNWGTLTRSPCDNLDLFRVSHRPLLNATSYVGFYISLLYQFFIIISYYILYLALSLLHIGFCSYLNAFVEDFAHRMTNLDEHLTEKIKLCGVKRFENGMKTNLIDAVDMHIKVVR